MDAVEARIMITAGLLLLALAILFGFYPKALAYPVVVISAWSAFALLVKGQKLRRQRH
jgi:hypothetical protein